MKSSYRYTQSRTWDERRRRWLWVLLNPGIADVWKDDNTIRRCVSFTTAGGGGGLFIANLYAWQTPGPEDLFMLPERQSVGPINDIVIEQFAQDAQRNGGKVVAAWGAHPKAQSRAAQVLKILRRHRQVHCLGLTRAGYPRHPLYVPNAVQVVQMP